MRGRFPVTHAVAALIIINIAVFGVQMLMGGSTNPYTLHRLGALEPAFVLLRGEYWRLLTALFLHYGLVHLLFNSFALYVVGPPLELAVGPLRFITCYLIAGIGSSAGVVILRLLKFVDADQLVGASGSIMGIVGAWAAFLVRHRRAPLARQRLRNVGVIVLMQLAFDMSMPQVSSAAHLCGLVSGFAIGFIVAPRRIYIGSEPAYPES